MFLYLHGFASGPTSSKAVYLQERLAQHGIPLLIPALDEGDFEHLTISRQLRVIEQIAGDQPVTLIGSSMGGYLASLYASNHPSVERLLLLAPAFGLPDRWPSLLGEEKTALWKQSGFLPVYHYGRQREAQLHYGLLEDAARYPAFPSFRQPALILHGVDDATVPVSLSERFVETHPNAKLVVMQGGHEMTGELPTVWKWAEPFLLPAITLARS